MKALIKDKDIVSVQNVAQPGLTSPDDVLIRVELAGLCRTDVYVAEGRVAANDRIVLGHEFSGTVVETGANVTSIAPGDRVAVMPVMPCGTCSLCTSGRTAKCQNTTMIGIDRDGAFAEYVCVPQSTVYKMPDGLSFKHGAYAEPVAAALSVIKSGIQPDQTGLIYGDNRFGQLIARILVAYGLKNITIIDPRDRASLPQNHFDFAVETMADSQALNDIVGALAPGGRVVIKSRRHDPVGIVFNALVKKEITLSAVNYGDFAEALRLMADGRLKVDDLLGDVYPLEKFSDVFAGAKTHEAKKTFFKPG